MTALAAALPPLLFEAPEPLRSGAFHRLVSDLWEPTPDAAARGTTRQIAAELVPALVAALCGNKALDPERIAFVLGLLAEAERESRPTEVGPIRRVLRSALPELLALLRASAPEDSPMARAREALLFLAAQLPEDAVAIGTAVTAVFGADSGAARAITGAWALAGTQPARARAILAYLGAEAMHRAGPDRGALLSRVLACPACRASVVLTPRMIECQGCGSSYPWRDDIPSLLSPEDATIDQFPEARVAEYETGTRPRFIRVMAGDFDGHITREREVDYVRHWLRPSEGPVLDLACGAGGWTSAVAAIVGADRLIALDFSLAMLASVHSSVPRATRVHGSASALPIKDGVLGAVNCSDALQSLPDPAQALHEVARTLMPGAPFTCFTVLTAPPPYSYFQSRFPDHPRSRFSRASLDAMVRDAGLDLIDMVTVNYGVFFTARKPAR